MTDFTGFGLPSALVETLSRMQYTTPTPIQEKTIPLALEGKDILGTAQTGTGKTGAFSVPIIAKLMQSPRGSALVMTPTRELAVQVLDVMKKMLAGQTAIRTALLIGGEPMPKQLNQLRGRPRLIVGTPGRINDHLTRGSLMLHDVNTLVLDETDRMLDMGFGIQIDAILKFVPQTRQTLLFSATLPKEILKISNKYLTNPERVEVGEVSRPAVNIDQQTIRATDAEKYPELLKQLDSREGSVIIFVKTKRGADKLADKLSKQNHDAEAIHGDLRQSQRDRVIRSFRNKRYRIMVATDVAARGLDIPHIEHVINYDLPQCPEDYIHRIGRTARAGAKGSALCFISPADGGKWKAIQRLLNPGAANDEGSSSEGGEQRRRNGNRNGNGKPRRFGNNRNRSFDGNGENRPQGEQQRRRRFNGPRGQRRDGGEANGNRHDFEPDRAPAQNNGNQAPKQHRKGKSFNGHKKKSANGGRRSNDQNAWWAA